MAPKKRVRVATDRAASGVAGESAHARLTRWLRSQSAHLDGLEIRASPSGCTLFASRAFAPGDVIGGLPTQAILDPEALLKISAVAVRALELGATEPFAFWLALADMATDETSPFHPYLAACPAEAPDPCSWSAEQRRLLDGTPLAAQVHSQRALLAAEYARVARRAAPHVPYDCDGVGAYPSLLWARGVHMSRCFPRALVEAAELATQHEVLASDMVDETLRVELGGDLPARVHWMAAGCRSCPSRDPNPNPSPGRHSRSPIDGTNCYDGCPPTGIPGHTGPSTGIPTGAHGAPPTGIPAGGSGAAPTGIPALPARGGFGVGTEAGCTGAPGALAATGSPAAATTPSTADSAAAAISVAGAASNAAADFNAAVASPATAGVGYNSGGADSLAGTLGCLLPGLDMMDHKTGHPIGWEAGAGQVRFRCRVGVLAGAPLYNNYGPKGNGELLFTYGFALRDNPMDSVEGIMVGCRPPIPPGGQLQEEIPPGGKLSTREGGGEAGGGGAKGEGGIGGEPIKVGGTGETGGGGGAGEAGSGGGLMAARRALLEEHGVPFFVRPEDGTLLIGPFELKEPLGKAGLEAHLSEAVRGVVGEGGRQSTGGGVAAGRDKVGEGLGGERKGGGGAEAPAGKRRVSNGGKLRMGEEQGAAEGMEARCASGGDGDVSDDETSDASESAGAGSSGEGVGVLPAGLLFALQVVGMENTDEGPVLSLDELDLLTSTLEHRLRSLAPTEAEDAGAAENSRAGFVAAYRDGQRGLLRAGLSAVARLAGTTGDEGSEADA